MIGGGGEGGGGGEYFFKVINDLVFGAFSIKQVCGNNYNLYFCHKLIMTNCIGIHV